MVQKPKKSKGLRKKNKVILYLIPPLTPDEMETELLDDRRNPELDPSKN